MKVLNGTTNIYNFIWIIKNCTIAFRVLHDIQKLSFGSKGMALLCHFMNYTKV